MTDNKERENEGRELCARGIHDWEATPRWGVVVSVSRCKCCDKISSTDDFLIARIRQEVSS